MKKLRRFVWYIASRLTLLLLLSGLVIVTLYYAMNASNIYIVLKDGMARRAQVIMMEADATDLNKYFQTSYLQTNVNLLRALEGRSPYAYYTVRGIDHRLSMTWMWCWPWESTARADFTESIPRIDGRVKAENAESAKALYGDAYQNPPAWPSGRYWASLVKENGQWRIKMIYDKQPTTGE